MMHCDVISCVICISNKIEHPVKEESFIKEVIQRNVKRYLQKNQYCWTKLRFIDTLNCSLLENRKATERKNNAGNFCPPPP